MIPAFGPPFLRKKSDCHLKRSEQVHFAFLHFVCQAEIRNSNDGDLMKFLIAIIFTHFSAYAEEQSVERRATKIVKEHNYLTPLGLAQINDVTDIMPGNNEHGFFIKNQNESKAICRLKFRVSCDYGFDISKPLKSKKIKLMYDKFSMNVSTDGDGLVDSFFHCSNDFDKKVISINFNSYNADFVLKNFPHKISLNEKECK